MVSPRPGRPARALTSLGGGEFASLGPMSGVSHRPEPTGPPQRGGVGSVVEGDPLVARIAAGQWGVVSRAQVLAAGLSPDAIALRLRRGRLHSVHRGVYAVGHSHLAPWALEQAAFLPSSAAAERWLSSAPTRTALLAAAVADLVAADRHQPGQAVGVEAIGDDGFDDLTDGVPSDPQQRRDRRLGHLLGAEGDHVLEVAGVARATTRERDRLDAHAAIRASHATQPILQLAALPGEIDVAPAPPRPVVDLRTDLAAARARCSPAAVCPA